ncbi:toxin-activating lysine-acyltransferase [Photobacterium sanctipauli]|uniref:RTX toxin-activating lysine-acyltransferase n=1 Tax=Photobacterium sanctipauli TaxID=1342794 RepID=A0A2T3N8F5_9GAMM|nr:toxin-activating lysine-acyltransferase [Photobacterium sanctipauli]PSW09577.1 toxin-activating lysine-acyltransferase [Photobacterium sanctipauli]
MQLLGEMTWLLLQSPVHQEYRLSALEDRFLHALELQQFQIFYDSNGPIGLVTWAWISEDWHQQLLEADQWLPVGQWQSGSFLWFMDFIAPFGHCAQLRRELGNLFVDYDQAWCRRVDPQTGQTRLFRHHRGYRPRLLS